MGEGDTYGDDDTINDTVNDGTAKHSNMNFPQRLERRRYKYNDSTHFKAGNLLPGYPIQLKCW